MDVISALAGATGSLLITIPAFLFVLTVVVFVHELGHFLVGRWCGVGVTAFSIGFGPELFGWTDRRGTRWKFCAIPLGGYVKFVGDENAASVPSPDNQAMSQAERAVSFHHKSVARRAAIVAAGPVANFLLAIAIFAGLTYAGGRFVLDPRVGGVASPSAAERAGFQKGDLVVSIDGRAVATFDDLRRIVSARSQEMLTIVVDRGGEQVTLTAAPDIHEERTPLGKQRMGRLGLAPDASQGRLVRYGLLDSLSLGVADTFNVVEQTFVMLRRIVVGRESAENLSGPIGIAVVAGHVAGLKSVQAMLGLVAVLSVSIGLINLFPIPLLDGGHLLFYAIEAALGRPLNERAQEIAFRIGLAIVLMLMLFTTWNDIQRHVVERWLRGGT